MATQRSRRCNTAKPKPGSMLHSDQRLYEAMVVHPTWNAETIRDKWDEFFGDDLDGMEIELVLQRWWRHSVAQMRADGSDCYDTYWSPEGELKSFIYVAVPDPHPEMNV